nr:hypothetical protein [Actinomycetota bacterium]
AIAIWAGFAGAGGAFGPIISGALLEEFWWGSTIIVNLPVIAVVAAASLLVAIAALAHGAAATRDIYLVVARFHLWLELAMAAYLFSRKRRERT